ncbi:hypothetical protein [Streptomyces sp. NPDC088752]|uniref:hypothetical protein n=1 Tax=Streptomyces sp. NPDC088752 TaxID=3154963 RepID=UPI00342D72AE
MPSKRLFSIIVGCSLLAAAATACDGDSDEPKNRKSRSSGVGSSSPGGSASGSSSNEGPFGSLTAQQIADRSQGRMATLSSLSVDGTLPGQTGPMKLHLTMDNVGTCEGTIGLKDAGEVAILRIGSESWIKPDQKFWQAMANNPQDGQTAARLFNGKYLQVDSKDPNYQDLFSACALISSFASDTKSNNTYTKGKTHTIETVDTIQLKTSNSSGEVGEMYIATEGEPYVISMEKGTGDSATRMTFSDFDRPLQITPPRADLLIDPATLESII